MIKPVDDLFSVLMAVRSCGGSIEPEWQPTGERGFLYWADDRQLNERDLETLAQRDYLERVFVDRISRCPWCRSHHFNMREICVACKSPRMISSILVHHFRCGYVAPKHEFALKSDGMRCPKCSGILRDRGTDHDIPGANFSCKSCGIFFQMPEIGAVCLSCRRQTYGDDLEKIVYEDVFSYRVSPFGASALRLGQLHADEDEMLTEREVPVLRRSVFMAFLEDERRRQNRFHSKFSVLLLIAKPPAANGTVYDERALIDGIAHFLEDTDKIGRYDENHYLVLLPSTDTKSATKLAKRLSTDLMPALRQWHLQARVATLPASAPTMEMLASSLKSDG